MAKIFKALSAFAKGVKESRNEELRKNKEFLIMDINRKISDQKVNHILHLILSLFTVGMWVIIWVLVVISSNMEISRLNGELKKLYAIK